MDLFCWFYTQFVDHCILVESWQNLKSHGHGLGFVHNDMVDNVVEQSGAVVEMTHTVELVG